MLISRTSRPALPEILASCSEITVMKLNSAVDSLRSSGAALLPALPLRRNSRRCHHLDHFRKQKPVKPPAERLRDRVCKNAQPGQTASKKYNLAQKPAQRGACESFPSAFHHKSRRPCHQRISQQKPACGAEQLCHPTRTGGIEYRHADRTLGQIQSERRESAPAAQQQANQQYAKILHRQWHRSERQRNRNPRAQCNKQTRSHHNGNLPRGLGSARVLRTQCLTTGHFVHGKSPNSQRGTSGFHAF